MTNPVVLDYHQSKVFRYLDRGACFGYENEIQQSVIHTERPVLSSHQDRHCTSHNFNHLHIDETLG